MDGEVMLTIKTNGERKVWAEDLHGDVVGLVYLTSEEGDWEAIEAVVNHARAGAERIELQP